MSEQEFRQLEDLLRRATKMKVDLSRMTPQQRAKESVESEKPFRKFTARKSNSSILCMQQGCQQSAINSHVISKNQYLKNIAVDNQVIGIESRDQFNSDNRFVRGMSLNLIGINEATTFKGYCKSHDNELFESIDNGPIKSIEDILLQCLRTIDYSLYAETWTTEVMRHVLKKVANGIGPENFRQIYCGQFDGLEPIRCLRTYVVQALEDAHQTSKWEPLPSGIGLALNDNYEVHFRRVYTPIPLAMYNFFKLNTGHVLYVIALPAQEYIDLIFICNQEFDMGSRWRYQITQDSLSVLNFLECCMSAFECWVASPRVFENMSEEKKALFQADIYNQHGRSFFKDNRTYDVSIFDEIRLDILARLPDDDKRKTVELHKISNLPPREAKPLESKAALEASELQRIMRWNI